MDLKEREGDRRGKGGGKEATREEDMGKGSGGGRGEGGGRKVILKVRKLGSLCLWLPAL
jgi:hypothetical protein